MIKCKDSDKKLFEVESARFFKEIKPLNKLNTNNNNINNTNMDSN